MTADQKERDRALDPTRSFIVQAPAGSGKTGLLVQRFLALLATIKRPESVVAMTFTRKAAADMRARVHAALLNAAAETATENEHEEQTRNLALQALARDAKENWRLLADPSRLQVQTIDSLCAMLTRQMPIVSEFGGAGDVIEDANELYRLAARRMLRDLAEGETAGRELFQRVALYFDNDIQSLERQIAKMLAQRDQWFSLERGEQDAAVDDFSQLLLRARDALRTVFRERGVVDFTEVTRAAIKALGPPDRPSDLLYRLDYRIEHLLVDEFQDTSRAQYDLIASLTGQWSEGDAHTLFVVGDPMQSIYRFRGAEVSLFLTTLKERRLGSVPLESLQLTTNFRSTPEIVSWVEQKFSPIMVDEDAGCGAVRFRMSIAARPTSRVTPELIPLIEEDDGCEEARQIIRIVSGIEDKGKVAILVRSRSHITAILPALREAGIRYEAIEIDELKQQQHVLDLLSLTRAVLHLGDRVSWLACLRAPWCGLTLADLSTLAEHDPQRPILDALSDPEMIARLSTDGRPRAIRVQEILSAAVANVGRLPLRELIEKTWIGLGGPAILHEPNQQDDVDTYLSLVENSEAGGIIGDFSLLSQKLECLYAKPSVGRDCVQVMTIFQAKGLEFDTVILPKLEMLTRSTERELLAWTEQWEEDGGMSLLIAAQPQKSEDTPAYKYISEQNKLKERQELKRVFYVACTRARNHLYLLGNSMTKRDGNECSKAAEGTFLGLLWDGVQADFENARRRRSVATRDHKTAELPKRWLRRLPSDWRVPRFEPSVDWQPEFQREAASARKISYEWVSGAGQHAGTVVHELLKRIAIEGAGQWSMQRLEDSRRIVEAELLRLGVPRSEHPQAVGRVMRAIGNTLASDRGQWILSAHAEARSEWPIAGRIADKLITGTIDRVFRDEQKRLWIIDFKTSEHEGGDLEKFLNEERRRYRTQLENYGTLISRLVPGPIWLGLYFPLLDGWREWQLEEAAVMASHQMSS